MASNKIAELIEAPDGQRAVLQGNIAFAVGCVRGGIHAADGYPGTPSTEVIDKALRYVQDKITVGWSVNEANAVAVGLGITMMGRDAVVTMKIPGLLQAADVVATAAGYTGPRGGLVLYVASDFVPSSTQYVFDPRYFLKSCFVPILEPRSHQEMHDFGVSAACLARAHSSLVVVLANGLICHSEGLVTLRSDKVQGPDPGVDFSRFMNLPEIARRNYQSIVADRLGGLSAHAEATPLNHIEWNDRSMGVIVHGVTELYLREVMPSLAARPSVLSLGMTFPVPVRKVREFCDGLKAPPIVLGDGLRFVQEELLAHGIVVEGKTVSDARTEWTPEAVADRLGARRIAVQVPVGEKVSPVKRPPGICAGCPYRAFGLVVDKLRKKRKIVASFGDIGCNTLLYFLNAVDTCTCMGAADSKRQGVVLADRSMAGKVISVNGDSTECHSGLDSTRNAVFKNIPGVKVVLDNYVTAMTGGQPAPTSVNNLAGERNHFDLVAALRSEGAAVEVVDAFDMIAIEHALRTSLQKADEGAFTVLVIRGDCMQQLPSGQKVAKFAVDKDKCKKCDLCLVCPGIEKDEQGYPRYTHLCTSCGGHAAICRQRCNLDGVVDREMAGKQVPPPELPVLHEQPIEMPLPGLAPSIRVATRGVGGQGNLFLGKVLAEVALLAGFANVIKGETHGMAQLGGAVISTFSCGDVYSPVLAPASVDILVAMEESEILRPGFVELLRPDGVVLLNRLRLLPIGVEDKDYPSRPSILAAIEGKRVVQFDALAECKAFGDEQGKCQNVVALGVLSTLAPLSVIPAQLWRKALLDLSPGTTMKRANIAAFQRGRSVVGASGTPDSRIS
jgi:indolepyruvate ferredoxin oxidoreductase alpha subunit